MKAIRFFRVSMVLAGVFAVTSPALIAQTPVRIQKAELSVNFGSTKGELISAGNLLIFVDQETPEGSFSLERNNISDWNVANDLLTVNTARPLRYRTEDRSSFAFRLTGDPATLTAWLRDTPKLSSADPTPLALAAHDASAAGKSVFQEKSYSARQKRFLGRSTEGRLVIQEKQVAFEANGNTERSRIWELKDIRALNQSGPYALTIEPFSGDTYNIELLEAMTPGDFKALQERVTSARIGKDR